MKLEKFIKIFVLSCFVILIFIFAILMLVTGIDGALSYEVIGEKMVPCIDERGRPFQDELCEKKISCSYLGLAGNYKCVNVLINEGGKE